LVENARTKLKTAKSKSIPLRQEHFKDGTSVEYRLLDIKAQKDSVFIVSDFHPVVKSLMDVKPVKTWLVPKSDTALMALIKKHNIKHVEPRLGKTKAHQLQITKIEIDTIEEINTRLPRVLEKSTTVNSSDYLFVSTANRHFYWLHFVLDPRSSLSLPNYREFEYLLKPNDTYPILYLK
jgi:hypothetical protein